MPVNIEDVDEFTDPIQAPADGDAANGAVFQLSPQGLANRTRNLKNRADGLNGQVAELEETVAPLPGAVAALQEVQYPWGRSTLTTGSYAQAARIPLTGMSNSHPGFYALSSGDFVIPSGGGAYVIKLFGQLLHSFTGPPGEFNISIGLRNATSDALIATQDWARDNATPGQILYVYTEIPYLVGLGVTLKVTNETAFEGNLIIRPGFRIVVQKVRHGSA